MLTFKRGLLTGVLYLSFICCNHFEIESLPDETKFDVRDRLLLLNKELFDTRITGGSIDTNWTNKYAKKPIKWMNKNNCYLKVV